MIKLAGKSYWYYMPNEGF